ncbi:MAG: hypothetical protein AABY88_09040 [Pseudomonadota bacterium]
MESKQPKLIAIDHDDYHAEYVGKTDDGRQFFLTTPFEPMREDDSGSEFVALYIFDGVGQLCEALIDNLGPRQSMDIEYRRQLCAKRLHDLGNIHFSRIEVAPFSVERFGTEFGLVIRVPEDIEDCWAVEAQPGNYMAFFEPWESGEYDT